MSETTPPSAAGCILVVDDSPAKRYATVSAIRSAGFDVLEAENGRDGLWLAASRLPALIVLDVNLPDIHGFEVVKRLKERVATAAIPVLHLSATRIQSSDKTKGLDGGADAYVSGFAEPAELLATINALLRAKKSEARATTLARQWQSTFDAISDGVCVVDADGYAQQCNKHMADLLGLAVADVVGQKLEPLARSILSFAPRDEAAEVDRRRQRVRELFGNDRWFSQTIDPIVDGDGVFQGEVQIMRDVTQRKTEDNELKEAKRLADAANQTKSSFLANMSHEIRSPLASILGYTELLRDEKLHSQERSDYLKTIARNGQQLVLLIDDILDLSKVEAGHLEIELIPFSLSQLLADVHMSLSVKAAEKAVELRFHSAEDVPEIVTSDAMRLRQILVNIVGNGIKFTDRGTVDLRVAVVKDGPPNRIEFVVEDTGSGIPAAKTDKLFFPFAQADSSMSRRFGGTGLGLVLSRNLAKVLGGDVTLVRSELGEGSTFRVVVEAPKSALPQAPQSTPPRPEGTSLLAGVSVLVADDAKDNRVLIKRLLSKHGASVDLVEDGREAIAAALATFYHVIIMDMQMPNIDGYTATSELRAKGYTRPIVALTAHAMREERDKSLRAGCDDYLTKPFNAKTLAEKVAFHAASPSAQGAARSTPSS